MVPRRGDSPHVPISAEEIAEQVLEVAALGITSVHLHARAPDESPSWERERFEDIILRIRQHDTDLVICVTTSGRNLSEFDKRSDVLELTGNARPDMASLTLSSLNFATQASMNSPETIKKLAARMREKGIFPEFEVFDVGMLNFLHYLIRKEIVLGPCVVNFILGGPASAQAASLDLGVLQAKLPERSIWSAGGIGRSQTRAVALALAEGGGVRVGLEDSLYWDSARSRLATNRELVNRVLALGEILERFPMRTEEFRRNWLSG